MSAEQITPEEALRLFREAHPKFREENLTVQLSPRGGTWEIFTQDHDNYIVGSVRISDGYVFLAGAGWSDVF